jgi:predicted RND superfamily exporter protein
MQLIDAIKSGHLREDIEARFGRWGKTVFRFRWLIIFLTAVLCSGLFSQLKHIQFDGTFIGFFYKDDPALQAYNDFRDQYGRDDNVIILLKTDDIFELDFLNYLKAFHERLEADVPYLVEIDSLINARQTLGVDDTLLVKDFLEDWPETAADLKRLKTIAYDNPNYIDTFLSADGKYTAIHMKNQGYLYQQPDITDDLLAGFEETSEAEPTEKILLSHIEEAEIQHTIDSIVTDFQRPDTEIFIAGGPYSTAALVDIYAQGMTKYTGIAIALIGFLLLVIFRRFSMVFLPLAVAFLAMMASLSPMAILKIPVSFSMQIVPSFLIAVGVGNSVHVCTIYYQAIDRGYSKLDAIVYSLQHCGMAIVMTGLTTAGGLLSFLASDMKPIAEFGTITPLGVLCALLFSLTLLPALLAVLPAKARKQQGDNENEKSFIAKIVTAVGDYSVQNPNKVLGVWALCIASAIIMALQIQFSFWVLKQLPPDHEVVAAITEIDDNMSGIVPLEFIIDSGKENGVKDPEFLNRLDKVNDLIDEFHKEHHEFIRSISIVNINKELHQALNQNDKAFYAIPDDPLLVSQELLLFENSGADDLEKVVDGTFRYARLTIATKNADAVIFKPMLEKFLVGFDKLFEDYDYTKTGVFILSVEIFNELYASMAKTYIIAFMVITPLMILLIGSLRVGLLCMIPNLAPITLTLGMMGTFGIDLTTATLLVGSIAMGLVVDDTIHFMHNFQRYYLRHNDVADAVDRTLRSTGLAITITTLVLSAGFLVFIFNTMLEWVYFGIVAGFCIFLALLADITLAPALLAKLYKHNPQEQTAS